MSLNLYNIYMFCFLLIYYMVICCFAWGIVCLSGCNICMSYLITWYDWIIALLINVVEAVEFFFKWPNRIFFTRRLNHINFLLLDGVIFYSIGSTFTRPNSFILLLDRSKIERLLDRVCVFSFTRLNSIFYSTEYIYSFERHLHSDYF